ncbi:hypothetical protein ACFL4G_00895 [Thermodesulfobacteriota bacterium]
MRREKKIVNDRVWDYATLIPLFMVLCTIVVTAGALSPLPAHAEKSPRQWIILPFRTVGVTDTTSVAFNNLLKIELNSCEDQKTIVVENVRSCGDPVCAGQQAAEAGADLAIYGDLNALGEKIFVNFYLAGSNGELIRADRMTATSIEELDIVAGRIVKALVSGKSVKATAGLGSITEAEAATEKRRKGHFGGGLALGTLLPFSDHYGDVNALALIDGSLCYETRSFTIEPHMGVAFDMQSGEGTAFEYFIDIRSYYIFSTSNFAPYAGGGVGLHYLDENLEKVMTTGNVMTLTNNYLAEDSAWGPSLTVGGGLMMLRTYTARLRLEVDYKVLFMDVNDHSNPQSITFSLGVVF